MFIWVIYFFLNVTINIYIYTNKVEEKVSTMYHVILPISILRHVLSRETTSSFCFCFQLADLLLLLFFLVFLTRRLAWFYDNLLGFYVYLLVHTLCLYHYQFVLKNPLILSHINQNRTYIFKNYTTWNIKVCEFLV